MRAGRWRRGRGPRSWGRFTRIGGLFRGRSGCGCSDRPSSEIAILAYSALFLAEDTGILRILADKGRAGVTVRIALGDPDGPNVAERGEEEGIGDAMAAKIRNALTLYRPLCAVENIEIRLHRTVLYNSIYRADDQLLVNQHTYGIPAAQAPVFCLCDAGSGEMTALYLDSFERVWASSAPARIASPISARADGFTDRSCLDLNMASDVRKHQHHARRAPTLSAMCPWTRPPDGGIARTATNTSA